MSEDKETTLAWASALRLKISYLLREVISEPDILDGFLNEKAMAIWTKAFTHESYDYQNNYEELEYLGDAVLGSIFSNYLIRRYPGLSKSTYTDMGGHYMSKAFQPVLAGRMNLDSYVRIGGGFDSNLKIDTDLFESFFGALFTIANMIQDFYGYAVCTVMLEHIFLPLELNTNFEPYKTETQQIFGRLGLGSPLEKVSKVKGKTRIEVYLTEPQLRYLASEGIRMPALIANGEGGTKKSTSSHTYQQAIQTLDKYGVNRKWSEGRSLQRIMSSDYIKPYVEDLQKKLKEDGFASVEFKNPSKTLLHSSGIFMQLVGVYPDGKKKILTSHYLEGVELTDQEELAKGRVEVIRKYLEQ